MTTTRRLLALLPALLLGALLALGAAFGARAQDVQPVPELSGRVIDRTGTLDAAQAKALEDRLAAIERERGSQVVVLMVSTTQPEDIAAYAQRVADSWKIGRRQVGDGVLVVVAKDDRRMRIEIAKALEGAIPDLAASRIIDEAMRPAFRAGDFAGGLSAAVDRIAARIGAEATNEGLPAPSRDGRAPTAPHAKSGFDWQDLAVFMFVAVPIVGAVLRGMLGRKLGTLATGGVVGGIGWWLTASLLVAGLAGLVALVMVGVFGIGGGRRGRGGFVPMILPGGFGGGRGGGGAASAASARAAAATSAAAARRATGEGDGIHPRRRDVNRLLRLLRHRWHDADDARRLLGEGAIGRIAERVRASELHHSGEIRVCVEAGLPFSYLWGDAPVRERALSMFGKLRVWDTDANNGVLIYVLLVEHRIEIVADRGLRRPRARGLLGRARRRHGAVVPRRPLRGGAQCRRRRRRRAAAGAFPDRRGRAQPERAAGRAGGGLMRAAAIGGGQRHGGAAGLPPRPVHCRAQRTSTLTGSQ